MNIEGCPPGFATDQVFLYNNPTGTCDMSIAAYVSVGVLLMIAKGILALLHVRAWRKRQRKLYAKADRRKHYPIVPTLSVCGLVHYALFFPLTFANIINAGNGWSYALHAFGWLAFGIMSIFFFLKIVRLGRRLVPIIREKKLNEMLEQQLRDEDDPPTWSSVPRPKHALTPFAANPMYEDDPPTYDETSSLPYDGPARVPSASGILGQNLANGRLMLEKQVMNGRMLLEKQVAHGRMILNGGKVPEPPTGFKGRPKRAMTNNGMKKVGADPPPKNPMWEEDPPTTYSILEMVEPQLDRLKRLDLIGQIFFTNAVLSVFGQFFIYFFVLTLIAPRNFDVVRAGFGLQAFFLYHHALCMNWQFTRVIHAVRESKRKSRRNDINIENGVKKLRGQQLTVLVLASLTGTVYLLLAAAVIPPFWYVLVSVMFFEVIANAIILRSFSTRLRGKINELKKQHVLKSPGNGANNNNLKNNQVAGVGAEARNANGPANGNGGGGGNGLNGGHATGANGAAVNGQAGNTGQDSNDGERRTPIYKSEVAHIRESTKFVSSSSRKPDDKDGPAESTISW